MPGDNRAPVVSERKLYGDMAELLARDLANVEAGIYPLPADHDGSLPTLFRRSRLFFDDLPDVHRRRKAQRHDEVADRRRCAARGRIITCRISTSSPAAG